MTPKVLYTLEVDSQRDGTYSGAIDNITQYLVGNITFSEGFTDTPYGEVAPPARMTLTLSNRSGVFDREGYLTSELVINGGFSAWTADDPDGWTVTGETAGKEVSQVAPDELHLGTGLGACNFWSVDDTELKLSQDIFTPGRTYELSLNVTNYNPGLQGVGGVLMSAGSSFTRSIGCTGRITAIFNAQSPALEFTNPSQFLTFWDMTFDDVSVKEVSRYRMMNRGMQMRLRATYNGVTSTLFQGRITSMQPSAGRSTESLMTITVEDAMLELLDAEYAPPFLEAVTGDVALQRMFDDAVIRWPYSGSYWLLGVPGHSELDYTTYLYDHDVTDFETGKTEFTYLGDVEDRGEGISAQGYIRDIVAGEAGGRFWFDPRSGKFKYQNRHYDALNDTIAGVYNESHFDSTVPKYGEDIVNDLTVVYTSRDVGAEGSILWTLKSVPFLLKNNNQRKFNARYFDANNEQLHVGARTTVTPVAGVDYIANVESDGSGDNMSEKINVGVEAGGNSAKVIVSNNSGFDVYVTLLQIKGTPITQIEERYQAVAGDSIAANELYPKVIEVRALDNIDLAVQFGDYTLARFKNPITRYETVMFNSLNYSDGDIMADAAINRLIGDKITITDSSTHHNKNYVIVGAMHTLDTGGDKLHDVTWILKPIDRDQFWMLGTAGKSELDLTTYLAF